MRLPKPSPKQFVGTVFDVALLGLLGSALAVIWTLAAVWACQLLITCLVVALLAAWLLPRIRDAADVAPSFRAPRSVRRDTVSPPVGETDESQDQWAGVTLDDAMDAVEAAEEERLAKEANAAVQ